MDASILLVYKCTSMMNKGHLNHFALSPVLLETRYQRIVSTDREKKAIHGGYAKRTTEGLSFPSACSSLWASGSMAPRHQTMAATTTLARSLQPGRAERCSAQEDISLEMPCNGAIANSHGGLRPDELHERKIKGTRNESESYLDLIATITRCLCPI